MGAYRGRSVVLQAIACLLIALVAVPVARSRRTVSVRVDGVEHRVATFAADVAGVLAELAVTVGPDDRVRPTPTTRLTDGATVEVVRAVPVTVQVAGPSGGTFSVTATTVGEAVRAAGLAAIHDAVVSPPPNHPASVGMVITVRVPRAVTVVADGTTRQVETTAPTVGLLLAEIGVALDDDDLVDPALTTPVATGLTVVVSRVGSTDVTEEHEVPPRTVQRETDELLRGRSEVAEPGAPGLRRLTWRVRLVDGAETGRELVADELVRRPRDRVVLVGTRQPPPDNQQSGDASWYDAPGGGLVAAHRRLPLGTVVTVTNVANSRSVKVRITDRGPFVDGRIIDLSREAFARLAPLAEGTIEVRIAW